MTENRQGIDISMFQSSVATTPGGWLFAIHKATEGTTYIDHSFRDRYPGQLRKVVALDGLVGAYHYARPNLSTGAAQANFFCDTVLTSGFLPGVDMWQLDCEGIGNESVDSATWSRFVDDFMAVALVRLGSRGFLYVGRYFVPSAFLPLTSKYNWWLPDYGNNDGSVHPLPEGVNPVLHQFSSAGALDRNAVHDQEKWSALVGEAAPAPGVLKYLAMRARIAVRPLKFGDKRKGLVSQVQGIIHAKYPNVDLGVNGVYGVHLANWVANYKRHYGLKPFDGKTIGRRLLDHLLKRGTK